MLTVPVVGYLLLAVIWGAFVVAILETAKDECPEDTELLRRIARSFIMSPIWPIAAVYLLSPMFLRWIRSIFAVAFPSKKIERQKRIRDLEKELL